jgi:hypothetical protein
MGLLLYFSIPSAIVSGNLNKEQQGGQMDVLSTLLGVKTFHSICGWWACAAMWLCVSLAGSLLFFGAVMRATNPLIPSIVLMLFGLTMCKKHFNDAIVLGYCAFICLFVALDRPSGNFGRQDCAYA